MLTDWSISLNTPRTPVATGVDRTSQPPLPHPEAARWRKRDLGVGGRSRLAWIVGDDSVELSSDVRSLCPRTCRSPDDRLQRRRQGSDA